MPKVSENINKSKISEALWIQASKAPKNFHHKPSKMKTHEEDEEREEQRISNKLIARDSL